MVGGLLVGFYKIFGSLEGLRMQREATFCICLYFTKKSSFQAPSKKF